MFIQMGSCSDEESDISDSEIQEYKEIPYELLKELAIYGAGMESLNAPFVLGKRRRSTNTVIYINMLLGCLQGERNLLSKG